MSQEGDRFHNDFFTTLVEEGDYIVVDQLTAICKVCGESRECQKFDTEKGDKPTIYICLPCSGGDE